jgi:tRNA(fMet)-specific endonuclease VapC
MAMLDTNTCIYAMKGSAGFTPKIAMSECGISVVVLGELEYGVARSHHVEQNRAALDAFLNGIRVHSLESETSEHYGRIRAQLAGQGRLIGNNDMWIAAHALTLGVRLVTHNTAEFSRVAGLVIDSWMG